jgi:cold shock CspA family protein
MPRKPKRSGPAARRPGFAAISRLVGREPLLADAAGVEADLADLCLRLAELSPGPEVPRWRQAARLSHTIAEALSDLAEAVADPPHHPRPTRLRVATLQRADLAAAAARIGAVRRALQTPTAAPPEPDTLAALWALEGSAVAAPLCRLFALCPTPPVMDLWRTLAARRRLVDGGEGIASGSGAERWPEPPARAARPVAWGPRPNGNGGPAPPAGPEWTADGRVERLDRVHRCGTARTDDGRTVFFPARAVRGGLAALSAGVAVTLHLRRGPLGLAAVQVTPRPGPSPPAA